MKKKKLIEILKKEAICFYGERITNKIYDVKRVTIYECAVDENENVLFLFSIYEDERKIVFYAKDTFRKDVRLKIDLFLYPLKNLRKMMYSNFRYLRKLAEITYEG